MKRKISTIFVKHPSLNFYNINLNYSVDKNKKLKKIYILEHEYDIIKTNLTEKKELSIVRNKRTVKYLKIMYKKLSGFSEFNNSCFKCEKIIINDNKKAYINKIYLVIEIILDNDEFTIWKYKGAYVEKNNIPKIFESNTYYISEEVIGSLYWIEGF